MCQLDISLVSPLSEEEKGFANTCPHANPLNVFTDSMNEWN